MDALPENVLIEIVDWCILEFTDCWRMSMCSKRMRFATLQSHAYADMMVSARVPAHARSALLSLSRIARNVETVSAIAIDSAHVSVTSSVQSDAEFDASGTCKVSVAGARVDNFRRLFSLVFNIPVDERKLILDLFERRLQLHLTPSTRILWTRTHGLAIECAA